MQIQIRIRIQTFLSPSCAWHTSNSLYATLRHSPLRPPTPALTYRLSGLKEVSNSAPVVSLAGISAIDSFHSVVRESCNAGLSPGSSLRSGWKSSECSIGFSWPVNSASWRCLLCLRRTKYPAVSRAATMPTTEPTAAPAIPPVFLEDDAAAAGEGVNVGWREREVVRGIDEVSLAEDNSACDMSVSNSDESGWLS
jgi:hypothetical protein